jgi:hypothetical protein
MSKIIVAEQVKALGNLLRETQKEHHQAYIETDGYHPDWAIWYAEYLFEKLPKFLNMEMIRSEIIYNLVLLDKGYTDEKPEIKWTEYYARYLLENYA